MRLKPTTILLLLGDWLTQARHTANGGLTPLPLVCFPSASCKLVLPLGPHCLASFFSFSHYLTMVQANNVTRDINKYSYIHHLSHITTLYLIVLFHYSHSHSPSLAADPHGPCNPGATMVVLCKRFAISLPVWPGTLNMPPLMCDSQYAQ